MVNFKKKYEKVVLIGSDLFDLEESHIYEAFEKLEKNEAVIGPALDGGYYLLGLKKNYPEIFINKNWGTSSVRKDTIKNLEKVNVHLLPMLNDIDVIEDNNSLLVCPREREQEIKQIVADVKQRFGSEFI